MNKGGRKLQKKRQDKTRLHKLRHYRISNNQTECNWIWQKCISDLHFRSEYLLRLSAVHTDLRTCEDAYHYTCKKLWLIRMK